MQDAGVREQRPRPLSHRSNAGRRHVVRVAWIASLLLTDLACGTDVTAAAVGAGGASGSPSATAGAAPVGGSSAAAGISATAGAGPLVGAGMPAAAGADATAGGGGVATSAGAAGTGGLAGSSELVALPDPVDPAAANPDFPIQGEYTGSVTEGAQKLPLGAQVIALGNAEFRAVFEPGGLPGGGSTGVKIDVNGKREGDVAKFTPGTQARGVETGGSAGDYAAEISHGKLSGTDNQGRPFALNRVTRQSSTLSHKPPEGAIVLFDGTNSDEFIHGPPNDYPTTYFPGEGGMSADRLLKEGATTARKFGDCLLHVEFRVPFQPENDPNYRGNSGVYLQGAYEVNILDSLGLPGKQKDNGVIWGVRDPDLNMSFPPLSWQTFDIDFVAARWNGDQKIQNAKMSVLFNGKLVHHDVDLPGATTHNPLPEAPGKGPVFLQSNPYPVRFRYIWVLEK